VTTNAFDAVGGEKRRRRIVSWNGRNKNTPKTEGNACLARPFVGNWGAYNIILGATLTTERGRRHIPCFRNSDYDLLLGVGEVNLHKKIPQKKASTK